MRIQVFVRRRVSVNSPLSCLPAFFIFTLVSDAQTVRCERLQIHRNPTGVWFYLCVCKCVCVCIYITHTRYSKYIHCVCVCRLYRVCVCVCGGVWRWRWRWVQLFLWELWWKREKCVKLLRVRVSGTYRKWDDFTFKIKNVINKNRWKR